MTRSSRGRATAPEHRDYDACLTDAKRWADFLTACDEEAAADPKSMVRALKFIDRYGDHIATQVATRRPELPNSTGAVEADLRELDKHIGDRAASFTEGAAELLHGAEPRAQTTAR